MSWLKKSQALESSLQKNVLKALKNDRRVGFVVKLSDRFVTGLPDVMCIANGYVVFIELKRRGGKVSAVQQAVLDEINRAGGYAKVCCSVSGVLEFIDEIMGFAGEVLG